MIRMKMLWMALSVMLPGLTGCLHTAVRPLRPGETRVLPHSVFITNNGHAVEPTVGKASPELDAKGFDRYLKQMWDSLVADPASYDSATGTRHILIRVHGGLNQLNKNLDRSIELLDQVRSDSLVRYYPIFVNWESGLKSSLGSHYHVRPLSWQAVIAPFVLAKDLGVGVARAPFTWSRELSQMVHDRPWKNRQEASVPEKVDTVSDSVRVALKPGSDEAIEARLMAEQRRGIDSANAAPGIARDSAYHDPAAATVLAHGGGIGFSRFEYKRSTWQAIVHHVKHTSLFVAPTWWLIPGRARTWSRNHGVGWIPIKFTAGTILDALGRPAWEAMHSRTTLMFHPDVDFKRSSQLSEFDGTSGAVSLLLSQLDSVIKRDSTTRYDITLIGHSMGAIVANRMVSEYPTLPWKNIVFMAGAASVSEFQHGALNVLRQAKREGREIQFYNLVLHPLAEARETQGFYVTPEGSLLEWIDDYFAYFETKMDRMVGKYTNFNWATALVPPDVRGQVHVKAFGFQDESGCGPKLALPYQHGHFNSSSVPFWRDSFWHPSQKGCGAIRAVPATITTPGQ